MKKLSLILFAVMIIVPVISAQFESAEMRKLRMATYAIKELYVDTINNTKLVEDAIAGMLEKLDPHSVYMNPKEVKEANEPLQGNFDGIGISFNMLNDTLFVISTISRGPSEKVGIQTGDRIVEVNDTVIAGVKMNNTDIMKKLRGKKGSRVNVAILRRGNNNPIKFNIVRDKIPIYSVDATYMADPNTGYIRISRFGAETYTEMMNAIADLKKQGMEDLIIDLQGNGGGYLNIALEMLDEFLNNGQLMLYTEGRSEARNNSYSSNKGSMKNTKVVILVDESSASASEILSGAMQDLDRAVVVGRRTFGKGLVQRPVGLPDGSMIRLTIARYYTPSGRCIQKPYENGKESYDKDWINRYNNGEMVTADSIHFPDSLRYTTINKKRIVYGGGGIMPDYFVPLDTTKYTNTHRDIVATGAMNMFVTSYFDHNQKKLRKDYPTFQKFEADYQVSDKMLDELKKKAISEKAKVDDEQFDKSKDIIKMQIKALVARDLFTMTEYFRIMNNNNEIYRKGLEIINDTNQYNRVLN